MVLLIGDKKDQRFLRKLLKFVFIGFYFYFINLNERSLVFFLYIRIFEYVNFVLDIYCYLILFVL